jgi:hypothetical protein
MVNLFGTNSEIDQKRMRYMVGKEQDDAFKAIKKKKNQI